MKDGPDSTGWLELTKYVTPGAPQARTVEQAVIDPGVGADSDGGSATDTTVDPDDSLAPGRSWPKITIRAEVATKIKAIKPEVCRSAESNELSEAELRTRTDRLAPELRRC